MNPPPNLVSVERAHLVLGTTVVLQEVSCGIGGGMRVGVVGRNGGGKSTLLRVFAGCQRLDGGRVTRPDGLRVGMLAQADVLDPAATVRAVVLGARAAHEWAGDARIRDVLTGLLGGLDAPGVGGLDVCVGTLSGGQRRRLGLAALLIADLDLLLLDEPTNHLDVEGIAWLAAHLARRTTATNALVVVTHDRWLLDAVATDTWEVIDGGVERYDGGYAAYVLAKAERSRLAATAAERRDNLLRKELAWLRRGAPARTSKPRFRLEAASALVAHEPPPRDEVTLARFATTRLGKDVVDLVDATVRLGGRTLLERVTWRLAPGDRIGILGVNGIGKSTLLRAVVGDVPLEAGTRRVGKTVVFAMLSQEVGELDQLGGARVVDTIEQVARFVRLGDKEISAAQLAQRLGFSGTRQRSRVADLSGGERRRLQLTRLLMTEPNVLLLDEPTNDLDIETLTSVEDVLDGWSGTLLVASHDRYLLERMCDRHVALLGDGAIRDLPGGVDQFLTLRSELCDEVAAPAPAPGLPVPDQARAREARKEMNRIERQLTRIADQEQQVHARMVERATEPAAMADLDGRLRGLLTERDDLESAWLEAAERAG